jgi:hypothetical protein
MDYVVGNTGRNSFYRASDIYPISIYAKDFDNNGSTGFIIGFTGDQRASGWGGAGNVQAPVSVIINSNTFTIASSSDPAGYFNNGYTYWSWTSQAGLSNGNFTFQVSIY